MTYFLIVLCFSFSGWLLSRLIVRVFLGKPSSSKSKGVVGKYLAMNSSELSYKISDQILSSSQISGNQGSEAVQKLRPEIENHINHFLDVKLSSVFPLLSQFIGSKTKDQMKSAFMEELDSLMPQLISKLYAEFLDRDKMAGLIKEKIETFNSSSSDFIQMIEHQIQPKMDRYITGFMLISGILCALIIYWVAH